MLQSSLCPLSQRLGSLGGFQSSVRDLALENLALRHQLAVLQRQKPRPSFRSRDRILWVLFKRFWPGWRKACTLVKPETVLKWHRAGFQVYWRRKSKGKPARADARRIPILVMGPRLSLTTEWAGSITATPGSARPDVPKEPRRPGDAGAREHGLLRKSKTGNSPTLPHGPWVRPGSASNRLKQERRFEPPQRKDWSRRGFV